MRLSSEEQDNGVAIERMLFTIQRSIKSFSGELIKEYLFQDLISGKRKDRPNFQELNRAVEHRMIEAIVFPRVDRMGREMELLIKLGKLFEATGVKAYVCQKEKFLDWNDPDDWEFWARSSVDAEKESRKVSYRLRAAHEFKEHKRYANFFCPFGYQRNPVTRSYEFRPDQIEDARLIVDLIMQHEARSTTIIQALEDQYGIKRTRGGLLHWLHNPVLRGHTPYDRENRYSEMRIEFDTHSGKIDEETYDEKQDFRILTEAQYAEILGWLKERSQYRGKNHTKKSYTLTGLCICAYCGSKAGVSTSKGKWLYIRCHGLGTIPHRNPGAIPYAIVEQAVKEELVKNAIALQEFALLDFQEEPINPQVLVIEEQINQVRKLQKTIGDKHGFLDQQIAELQREIKTLAPKKSDRVISKELRDRLSRMTEIQLWNQMTQEELRSGFLWFVDRVICDFASKSVRVDLKTGLVPIDCFEK